VSEQKRFIVAEISKNWNRDNWQGPILAQLFEDVIDTNRGRGYLLHSFQLHRLATPDGCGMNETIIAVFEREPGGPQSTGERRS
jgi:hypothetical protein